MKFLQSALCGLFLSVSAVAQMAPTSTPASPQTASPTMAPKISTLGGDVVKGPEHPLTLDQMKVLYVTMGYDASIDQNLNSMITMQKTRAPFIPQDVWDDLSGTFKKIDYPTALLDVYKKYLSTEDAAKLIEFSKTEAGKHYFETTQPTVSREIGTAIQKLQGPAGQEVQARHKDEIDAALKKYREEHAPKPTSPAPTTPAAPGSTPAPSTPPASTPPAASPQH